MQDGKKVGRTLRDFSLAALLLLAANFLFCGAIDATSHTNPRLLSHRVTSSKISGLRPEAPLDLVILGDSRSMELSADTLCALLPGKETNCFNASSTSGDWVTAHLLFELLAPHRDTDTRVLIFVSDYWLEGPDTGLLPRSMIYAALGQPLKSLESFLPLSTLRRARMEWLHDQSSGLATRWGDWLRGGPSPADVAEAEQRAMQAIYRSNVDAWFAPVTDAERAERRSLALAVLQQITASQSPAVLVYLPNFEPRDQYVDEHYPGRRQRFMTELRELASELELPLLDLRSSVRGQKNFKDFHHLSEAGVTRMLRILAREIAALETTAL